jgi:hypothetical protein
MQPEYAHLQPLFDAWGASCDGGLEETCATLTQVRHYLVGILLDEAAYRRLITTEDLGWLVTQHEFMAALVRHLPVFSAEVNRMAVPRFVAIRDALACEGHRRGVILHEGDDPSITRLSICIALFMAGPA